MRPCFLLIACAAAFAQQPGAVRCTVVETGTGAPLEGVHAQLVVSRSGMFATEAYGGVTQRDGRFSIAPIPAGAYLVRVEKRGYLGSRRDTVSVKAGETNESCRFEMTRRAGISGRVTDANGDPVANVRMVAVTPEGKEGSLSTVTDSRGEYRLAPAAGRYRIKADVHSDRDQDQPAEIRTDGTSEIVYGPTVSPNVIDAAPGAEITGVDIRLQPWQAGTISGEVSGAVAEGVAVMYYGLVGGGSAADSMRAAGDGSFTLTRLRPGSYWLYAQSDDDMRSAPVAVTLGDAALTGVRLRIRPRFDVAGRVSVPDGRKAERVRLEVVDVPAASTLRRTYESPVAADGSFRIAGITAAKYRVHVLPTAGDLFVKAPAGPLELSGTSEVNVVVAEGAARIAGRVEDDGGPITHGFVHVRLTSESGLVEEHRAQDATYSFDGLAPGKYKLYASDPPAGRSTEVAIELQAGEALVKIVKVGDAR